MEFICSPILSGSLSQNRFKQVPLKFFDAIGLSAADWCNRYIWLFLVVVGTPGWTWADPLEIEDPGRVYFLSPYIEIYLPDDKSFTFSQLLQTEKDLDFRPFREWSEPFQAKRTYWGKLTLGNGLALSSNVENWVLDFPLTLTEVNVWVKGSDGEIQHSRTGAFVPVPQRHFVPIVKANLTRLRLTPGDTAVVYFNLSSDRASIIPEWEISLLSNNLFFTQLNHRKQIDALFIGFVLMMLSYNLILYFFAKDVAYIYYAVYLTAIIGFSLYNTGDLADRIGHWLLKDHPEYIYLFKPITYLALLGYMAFIRSFLDLKELLPRWDKIFRILILLSIPFVIIDVGLMIGSNFSPRVSDFATLSYSLVFVVVTFIFLVPLYQTGDKKGYFIVAGITAMNLGIVLTIIARLQSIDFSTTFLKIGSILEIIAFSLGLAYRQRENEQAKQEARFELEKSKLMQIQEHNKAARQKELNALKSRFYTNITHEFRTPLTVIMGMVEQIKGNRKKKELIHRNSRDLLRLISQMLDLAKLEAGKLSVEYIQADIIAYLRYLTESFYSSAQLKNIRLVFYAELDSLLMDFDEVKIQHIVQNLLSNALKFTPENGKVIFHACTIESGNRAFLQLKLKDTGVGIAANDLPHIFDRFYQASPELDGTTEQGTGIGLALTKELVLLVGGTIEVRSKLHQGTEFTIKLPINNTAEMEEPVTLHQISYREKRSADIAEEPVLLDGAPIILIIEDNNDIVTYIQSILKKKFTLYVAHDGKRGIERALEIVPDLVISDIMMPKSSGLEVCQTLKNDERTSHIPIILLTAKATEKDKLLGLQYGADAYIIKPFNKEELLIRVEKLIESRRHLLYRLPDDKQLDELKQKGIEEAFLDKLTKVIEASMGDPDFGMAQLSRDMNLSYVQIYRKLKAISDKTPTQFLRTIRLQKAMTLLQNKALSIAEIAYKVGFNDPNYFTRLFHQEFGETPSELRR